MVASPELIIDGKSSKENVKDTKERVKSQVDKELQQLTNEIWKNFYKVNENGEVEYDLDLVKKYLETKKDKQYSELKSQNTSAWIMAVQIALSSVGYDVGKVDWILKNRWAKTSKTVDAIKRFQRDNELRPDGQPGSKTITKLLEKLWNTNTQDWNLEKKKKDEKSDEKKDENKVPVDDNIEKSDDKKIITKAEFDLLCIKASLSDEEMRKIVTYANEKEDSRISLGVNSLTQSQLNELSKIKTRISLIRMEKITNNQLKVLSNTEELALNSLREIKREQAEILANSNIKKLEMLSLNGHTYNQPGWLKSSMTDEIAKILANSKNIEDLYVNPVRLTQSQKKILESKLK